MSKLMEIKRFVLVLLILMLSLGIGVYSAYANEPGEATESNTIISGSGSWQNPLIPRTEEQPDTQHTILSTGETAEATNPTELKLAIQQGFIQRQASFSMHYTGDTSNMESDIAQIINEVFADDDYLYYSKEGYGWGYEGYVNDVTISFTASYVSTREQEDYVEQQVPIILAQIISPEMSTLEKVKAVNDYIVLNTKYSDTTSDPNISPHSAYALLKEGQGVCQGYALLAYKMLQQTGIPVRIIVGNAGGGGHAWNLVQISNQWYHLDATWNDPLPNSPGQVNYNYFLRNNTIAEDHSWVAESYPETTDNSFDYFHVMLYASSKGENIYYSHQSYDNQLYRSSIDGTEQQKLNNNRSYYITVAGNWIYYSNYSYGGYLFKIRTNGSDESLVVEEWVTNIYVKDNILYYTDGESGTIENYTLTTYSIAISTEPVEGGTVSGAGSYLEGDIVTLTATADEGYTFTKWKENGTEVSTDAKYTFTADSDRNLTAEFQNLSNDATLSSIEIDGNNITGFSSTTETYNVELPYGTTAIPEVTAVATDTRASIVITSAVAVPGTTTIEVTAKDGVTTKTYTINFTVAAPLKNTDATLSDLKVDGTTVTGFDPSTLIYNVVLAPGTTTVPTVTVVVTDTDKASAVITPATSLPGSTEVIVTAEDGVTTKTYTINFTVAAPPKNTDATLSDLKVDGTTVTGFTPSTLTYNVVLPPGTTTVPTVTVAVTDTDKASAVITPATSLPGSTEVIVTAEDGVTTKTYKLSFSVGLLQQVNYKVYINGNEVQSDVGFYEYNNIIYGPLRCVADAMGLQVSWDAAIQQATFESNGDTLVITINSSKYSFNGVEYDLPGPATISNGRTIIPIKTVVEAFGGTFRVDTPVEECFIATAAFGSKFTWPVTLLRDFRDQYLLTNSWGTAFVSFYYQHSPPIATIISNNQTLKTTVRVLLAPLVAYVFLVYHPTILLLIMIMVIFITSRFIYRRYLTGN